jgi:CubicO group peptidase (beta-lactamase class C family)
VKTRNRSTLSLLPLLLGALALPASAQDQVALPREHLPVAADYLRWSPTEQPYGYTILDKLFATRAIKRGPKAYPLPRGKELAVTYQLAGKRYSAEDYMDFDNVAGLLVIKNGRIVLERYALGLTEQGHWTSNSMVKSMTSTLVGAAIQDGAIKSLDDKVVDYLPALAGSAYAGTTVRNLITMSSGVRWNEDYADKDSDINHFAKTLAERTPGGLMALMKSLPKAAEPGTVFHYSSGDTYLLGNVVMAATHKGLAQYMSEKVWANFGMEADGFYLLDQEGGQEMGGHRVGATLRDFGRFGLFVANGGMAGGKRVLPEHWVDQAGQGAFAIDPKGNNLGADRYGYSWWLVPDGSMVALGFAGQTTYINRKENLVIVTLAAWPQPPYRIQGERDRRGARQAFTAAVVEALR